MFTKKDGNGSISVDELRQLLGANNNLSDLHLNQIIQQVDQNGDGEVSYIFYNA